MPDVVDLAQTQNERMDQVMLTIRKPTAPDATGFCLNCGEPLSDGRRWCDADCRDDWQRIAIRRE
jgi:hypothetical protein